MYAVPFEKMIPSKDVRDYCEKTGREFTLSEQATLVFNNPLLCFDEVDSLLEKILSSCGDEDFTECVPRVNNRFEDNYVEVPHPFKKGDWNFSHDHPYIPTLVYAELAENTEQEKARKELFEVAQELLRGEGSLEVYGYTFRDYNEKY